MGKDYLVELNNQLKSANIGVCVRQKGNRLYLRATLPPKPGSKRKEPHQQEVALGIYANPPGFKRAKGEAIALGAALALKQFSWELYVKAEAIKPKLVSDWVKEFEVDYFTRRQRNPKSETTYEKDYRLTFNRLDPNVMLTKELLKEAIAATPPDTRTRQRYCMALGALAKFAGIEIDLRSFRGSYSPSKAQARELPRDELIEKWRSLLVNPGWQWVYGMLAVYGLRPHEVFHLDLERLRAREKGLRVLDGKTGARLVFPFPLSWWEEWRLWEVVLPTVTANSNSEYGNRVQQCFKRAGLPFRPYDLRHAWAVRTLDLGLDLTLASQQMGHSVQVHSQIYHRWISEKTHQEAFDRLLRRDNS